VPPKELQLDIKFEKNLIQKQPTKNRSPRMGSNDQLPPTQLDLDSIEASINEEGGTLSPGKLGKMMLSKSNA